MNIKKITLFALAATMGAAMLRSLQFLFFFNSETGFFTDDGILSMAALALSFLVPVVVYITAAAKKTLYGRVRFRRSIPMGLCALLCSGLMAMGVRLVHGEYLRQGPAISSTAMGISFRGPFLWACAGMTVFMFISAIAWISGKALFQHARALYLISVAWALSLILYVFIHYSISVLTTETLFIILLSCSSAVAFMAQARFFADLNPQGKSLRLLVPSTVLSAVLMTSYALSGFVVRFAGIHSKNEVSLALELVILAVGLFMFFCLFSLSYVPLAVPTKGSASAGKRYKVDIKREL